MSSTGTKTNAVQRFAHRVIPHPLFDPDVTSTHPKEMETTLNTSLRREDIVQNDARDIRYETVWTLVFVIMSGSFFYELFSVKGENNVVHLTGEPLVWATVMTVFGVVALTFNGQDYARMFVASVLTLPALTLYTYVISGMVSSFYLAPTTVLNTYFSTVYLLLLLFGGIFGFLAIWLQFNKLVKMCARELYVIVWNREPVYAPTQESLFNHKISDRHWKEIENQYRITDE